MRILLLGLAAFFAFGAIAGKPKPKKKDELVIIHTEFGDMTVLLYEETPLHKANFLKLAKNGYYDSTIWHRVIEDFMVQGGDVTKKSGLTDFDNEMIEAEFVKKFHHKKGALAAARTNNPEKKSSSCQFYIVQGKVFDRMELEIDEPKLNQGLGQLLAMAGTDTIRQKLQAIAETRDNEKFRTYCASLKGVIKEHTGIDAVKEMSPTRINDYSTIGGTPHLDDTYTVYGEVIEGIEVVDKLAAVETLPGDRPKETVYMTMEVFVEKTKNITEKYGYVYPPVEKKKK